MSEKREELKNWGVSLEDIPPEGLKIEFKDIKTLGEEIKISLPFSGYFKLKKRGIEVKLGGSINGEIVLICDRCLSEFNYPIKHKFDLILKPAASLNIEGEKELGEEDMEVSFYEGEWISFYQILREEVLLSIPYKKLCREDCKGICPICGKDLNKGSCNCRRERKNSPFAILKELLEKKQTSEKEG